jgi:site-specific recombinase XerD
MARVKKIGRKDKVTWKEAADNFLLLKRAQGIAPRTLEEYEYHLKRFDKKMNPSLVDADKLRKTVLAYFADSASAAPATFNMRRHCLMGFFKWAVAEGIIAADPMVGITKRKENGSVNSFV